MPNVSFCTTEGDVYYNPSTTPPTPTETKVVAKYYVDYDGEEITLFYLGSGSGSGSGDDEESNDEELEIEFPFTSMEVDGIEKDVAASYTFDTAGEHTVKFTLAEPTTIGGYAFYDCYRLTSITSLATTAPTINRYTFRNINSGSTLYVPSGSSGYDTWMQNSNYYLGLYNWTKVEQ